MSENINAGELLSGLFNAARDVLVAKEQAKGDRIKYAANTQSAALHDAEYDTQEGALTGKNAVAPGTEKQIDMKQVGLWVGGFIAVLVGLKAAKVI